MSDQGDNWYEDRKGITSHTHRIRDPVNREPNPGPPAYRQNSTSPFTLEHSTTSLHIPVQSFRVEHMSRCTTCLDTRVRSRQLQIAVSETLLQRYRSHRTTRGDRERRRFERCNTGSRKRKGAFHLVLRTILLQKKRKSKTSANSSKGKPTAPSIPSTETLS